MNENSTDFALFIEEWLHQELGVSQDMTQTLKMVILFFAMLVIALLLWFIAQGVINKIIEKVVRRTNNDLDDILLEQKAFRKLGHIAPTLVIFGLTPIVFTDYPKLIPAIETITTAILALIIIRLIISVINSFQIYLSKSPKFEDKPIESFTQLSKIIVWSVGIIILISIIIGKNPLVLFGALGAVSAVLLLIFKDTILGFIASIQLTINDMVRLGDWVSVPKYGADGNVVEINLTTVKVQNWDNTITTVPTYSFVSDSFKNFRGMEESGGRRIKRSVNFKISSIRFVDDDMHQRYTKITLAQSHIARRSKEIVEYNREHSVDTESSIVNGRRMTNIGVFRAYVNNYIRHNPNINIDMTCMVRQLDPTPMGVPLEIYCFSRIKSWVEYEGIQSDIFDHILATAGHFDLDIFENPASSDFKNILIKAST